VPLDRRRGRVKSFLLGLVFSAVVVSYLDSSKILKITAELAEGIELRLFRFPFGWGSENRILRLEYSSSVRETTPGEILY
jgi:hypothetical protein